MSGRDVELTVPEIDGLDTVYKRRLATAVALIALSGGLVGFAASDAGARQAQTAREAQRSSVAALARQNDANNAYFQEYGNFAEVSVLDRQRDIASVTAELLGDEAAARQARQWRAAGDRVGDVATLRQDKYEGHPELLFNELWLEPNSATLRQQAAQETASSWGTKSDRYVGIVTLLAVALTLLGLSLTVGAGVRLFLVAPAALIVAGSLVGALIVLVQPAAGTPEEAIAAVAEGDRLAQNREYEKAVESYTRAIATDDDYVTAYQRRAIARLLAGSPERDLVYFVFSSSSDEARRAAIDDMERALDLGGDDYLTLAGIGANYFHLGDYERTRDYSQRAIDINPSLPLPWSNLTLGLAGLGREDEAVTTAQRAIELILARPYLGERRELLASARATLESLASRTPEREPIVRRLQGMMVAAQSTMEAPTDVPADDASVTDLKVASAGSILTATMSFASMPAKAPLAFVVYYRSEGQTGWSEPSGQSGFYTWQYEPNTPLTQTVYVLGCHTSGEYRFDVYTGARRLGSATVAQEKVDMTMRPYHDWVGGLQLCVPETWTESEAATGRVDLTSGDGRRGMSMRSAPLAEPPGTEAGRQALITTALDRLAAQLSPTAATVSQVPEHVNSLPGVARYVNVSATEQGYIWVSLTAEGVLRATTARYPVGEAGEAVPVVQRSRFIYAVG